MLKKLKQRNTVKGLGSLKFSEDDWCEACASTKLTNKAIPKETEVHRFVPRGPVEKLHVDTAGPFPAGGAHKFKYFVLIVDEFSKYKWLYCVTSKSYIPKVLVEFLKRIQNLTKRRVCQVKCDNGTEFVNSTVQSYCAKTGVDMETSAPGTPQLNGTVERGNRTVTEGLMAMLAGSSLSKWYWPFAAKTFVYLNNRVPTRTLEWVTPYTVMWGKKPDVSHLRVFGSRGFALDGTKKQKKLQQRARPALCLGYNTNMRTYVVKWLDTGRVGVARTGRWNETAMFCVTPYTVAETARKVRRSLADQQQPDFVELFNMLPAVTEEDENEQHVEAVQVTSQDDTPQHGEGIKSKIDVANILRTKRSRRKPDRFEPPETATARKAIVKMSKLRDPLSFDELQYREDKELWSRSYQREIDSLEKVGQFEVIDRGDVPEGQQVLPVLELFKEKSDGRRKTRIVVRGDLQHDEASDVYSPTANATAVRLVTGLAAAQNWKLRQLDVSTAYLYGRTSEPTYIELPKGHAKRDGHKKVYKTWSSVYGLKEAPKIWYETLTGFLVQLGFQKCPVEKCLFYKQDFYLLVYVDDILYSGRFEKDVQHFEEKIRAKFEVRIEPEVTKFVGFEVKVEEDFVKLSHGNYIRKLVESFGLKNAKTFETPMQANLDVARNNGRMLEDPKLFQALLGAVLYLNTTTRPDISFAVNRLSRHAQSPSVTHLVLLKRIVRYLKTCPDLGVKFHRTETMALELFVDSSWANGEKRKGIFGYAVLLNGSPVAYKTKQQSVVALSSTEAEYIGMCEAVKELMAVKNLLQFLEVKVKKPFTVYNDNQGALFIGKNLASVSRTRHVEMKYYFVQDLVEKKEIQLVYMKTTDMIADVFTKALGRVKFQEFREKLVSA